MKSVQLVGANNFQAGDYTVNVKGLTEKVLTGSVKIEAAKVASIEILSEEAVLSENPNGFIATEDNITATVGYIVKDQYGTDITKTTTLTTNSVNDVEAKEGTVTIKNLAGKKIGDLVPVVLIHADSATTVSKTLKLSAAATVSDIQVEGVYDDKGKVVELKDNTKAADVYLVLNLKDQYNNEIKPANAGQVLTSVIVTNTNPLVTKLVDDKITVKAIDGKNKFVVKFAKVDADNEFKGGSAELLFIKTMDGKTFKHTVNVTETQTTDSVTVGKPEFAIVGEDVLVPITVLDKEGNVITDKKILTHTTKGIKVNTEPAKSNKITVKDGQVYYNLDKAQTADKYETVTVQTSTFKIATVTYKVTPAAKPVAVRGFKTQLVIKAKANKDIEFDNVNVEDQYGRTMKELTNGYKVAVEDIEAKDNKVVTVSGNKITAGNENGTAVVTIYLTETKDGKDVKVENSAVEQQVRVTDGKEYTGYEIAPIGKTQVNEAKEFTVNGLLGNGKVKLATNEYTAKVTGGLNKVTLTADKFEVKTENLNIVDSKAVDTEFTLTVTINATGKTLEQKFTVSPDAKKVQEFFFTTDATTVEYKDAKAVTEATVNGKQYGIKTEVVVGDGTKVLNVATVDQYNNKEVVSIAADSVVIVAEDIAKVDIIKNGTKDATATLATDFDEAKLTVTVKIGNATKDLNVTLKRDVAGEAAAEALAAATLAVDKAEETKKAADKTAAQDLVTALTDGAEKTALQDRIDEIVTAEDTAALASAKTTKKAVADQLLVGLTEADYTVGSWKALTDAIEADKVAIDAKTTVTEVNAYTLTADVSVLVLDTAAIDTAILAANAAKVDVEISVDGTDIATDTKWVTQADSDALDAAIATATAAKTSATTAQDVTDAAAALDAAVSTYNTAKADGTQV